MKKICIYLWSFVLLLFTIGLYGFGFHDDPIQQLGIFSMLLSSFISFFLIFKLSFNEKDNIYKTFIILSALICPLTVMQILEWYFIYLIHDLFGILSLLSLLVIFIRKNRNKLTTSYENIFIIGALIYFSYSFMTSNIPIGLTTNFWVRFAIISTISLLGNFILISKKINTNRIKSEGKGETKPKVKNMFSIKIPIYK